MQKIIVLCVASLLTVSPALYCASSSSSSCSVSSSSGSSSSAPRTWTAKEIAEFLDNHTKTNAEAKKIISDVSSNATSPAVSFREDFFAVLFSSPRSSSIRVFNLRTGKHLATEDTVLNANKIEWDTKNMLNVYIDKKLVDSFTLVPGSPEPGGRPSAWILLRIE